jgi:hypothetical protein
MKERAVASLKVIDETTAGERSEGLTLEFLTERVTVRELIRSRVYQEVTERNARWNLISRQMMQPSLEEQALNGEQRSAAHNKIDWEQQFERALAVFEGNGFLIFAAGKQLLDLDEEITLGPGAEVTFLRLVPLVGG